MLQSDWSKFTNSPNCSSFWPEVSCQPALRRFGLVPLRWSTMFETTAAHGIFSSSDLTGPSASVGITAALIQFTFKAAPGWRLKGNCSRATGNQRPVSTTASGIEVPHMTGGLYVYVIDASRSSQSKLMDDELLSCSCRPYHHHHVLVLLLPPLLCTGCFYLHCKVSLGNFQRRL